MNIYIITSDNVTYDNESAYKTANNDFYIFDPVGSERRSEHVLNNQIPENPQVLVKLINPWTFWDENTKLNSIRLQRNYLLQQTDWRTIKSVDTDTPESQAWKDYRQELRDFTNVVNVNLPIEQIVWPVSP